jgi:hypothetical protein
MSMPMPKAAAACVSPGFIHRRFALPCGSLRLQPHGLLGAGADGQLAFVASARDAARRYGPEPLTKPALLADEVHATSSNDTTSHAAPPLH